MRMSAMLEAIRQAAIPHGLNLIAAIPVGRYDAVATAAMRANTIAPQSQSIVVIGNGGGAFWRSFSDHAARNPGWREREHPLDDFTRLTIERDVVSVVAAAGVRCVAVYPFIGDATLNFIELGKLSGLAGPSILGVVVNPIYGPWIAFRAALLVDAEIDEPGDAVGFDPCPTCTVRSCISACPVGAVSFPAGWDIPRCLKHRVEVEPDCAPGCHARIGCVIGPQHRYPDDELAYHQGRALRAMRPYYDRHLRES
jgi:hypothetical protein